MWDVQEILAERTSVSGERELLVIWKTTWIPKRNMIPDGPIMRRFNEARKWTFVSSAGVLILPVEPGTMLEQDCRIACDSAQEANAARQNRFRMPRKALGNLVKSAPIKRKIN
jgi:hypothetical protein